MNIAKTLVFATASLLASVSFAQQTAYVAPPWTYKTKQLNRTEVDALLAKPQQVVVLDVRRPDELISKGAFPAYLNIQVDDVEKSLGYIPKERTIITVSNRAHRAGAVGDILSAKGYKVAGATGTLDYEDQGGKVAHIQPPAPKSVN